MRLHQKKVMVLEYDPSKPMALGIVEILDSPGALYEVLRVLERQGAQPKYSSSYVTDQGRTIFAFLAETKGADARALGVALGKSPVVVESQVLGGKRGLVSDTLQFPVWAGGERVILLRTSAFTKMVSDLVGTYGSGGQALIYQEGLALGADRARGQLKIMPRERLRELEPELLGVWAAVGWGVVEVTEKERDLSRVVLRIRDSFEASGVSSRQPSCWFFRGALTGYVSEISGWELSSEETKCEAVGDEFCEFILVAKEAGPTESAGRRARTAVPRILAR